MPKLYFGLISQNCGGKGTGESVIQEECPGTPSFRFSTRLREFLHRTNELVPVQGNRKAQKEAYRAVLTQIYGADVVQRGWSIARNPLELFRGRMGSLPFPLVESRENLQEISTSIRQTFGEDTLARQLVRDVMASNAPVVNIEGIRRKADMWLLRALPGFTPIFIDSPEEMRWTWSTIRDENEGDADMTLEEFKKRGQHEAEREIAALMYEADIVIGNYGSKEEFVHHMRMHVRRLCAKYGV